MLIDPPHTHQIRTVTETEDVGARSTGAGRLAYAETEHELRGRSATG